MAGVKWVGRVPSLHHDHGPVDQRQLGREQEEVGLAAAALVGGIIDEQVDLLVARLAARLDLVFARLPHQKAVLLEIFADNIFVDGRHLDFGFRIPETGNRKVGLRSTGASFRRDGSIYNPVPAICNPKSGRTQRWKRIHHPLSALRSQLAPISRQTSSTDS